MVDIKNLTVKTKNFSIENLSLRIDDNKCHAIIGPTGCGKTTLLEAILGLRKVESGEISLDGNNVTNEPTHNRTFAYVPQDLALFPHLTVRENIFFSLKHRGGSRKQKLPSVDVEGIIHALGIEHLLDRNILNLSGGEKQRVALARALASGYRYLLLDEPLSALHEGLKKELWLLIKRLQKDLGLTILIVSHDMEETFFLADDVTVMIEGKIHQSGAKKHVYRYPSTLEVASFFGINNLFKGKIQNITDEFGYVYAHELDKVITFYSEKFKNLKIGDEVFWGVRAEEIMILKNGSNINPKDTKLEGVIKNIFWKGGNYTLLFNPYGSETVMEIAISGYAFRKFKLEENSPASVALRNDWIFIMDPPEIQ